MHETQLNTPFTMSGTEKRIDLLKRMLSGRDFVCPGCRHAYADFRNLKNHLDREKDTEDHQGLLQSAKSRHRKRDQMDAFGRDRFAEKEANGAPDCLEARLEIYLKIAIASGMKFVCPQCVTETSNYFNEIIDFYRHCREKADPMHLSFLPNKNPFFLYFYRMAMGRAHIDEPPGIDNPGPQTRTPYMQIKFVTKEKNFLAGLT